MNTIEDYKRILMQTQDECLRLTFENRELKQERDEAREDETNYYARINKLIDFGNKLADECDRILGLGLHQNTLLRFKDALESWRKNN